MSKHLVVNCIAGTVVLLDASTPVLAQSEFGGGMTMSVLRAILALVFVLALFFLLIFVVRRYYPRLMQRFPNAPGQAEQIEIRSSRSLGPKRFLYIVRVGTQNYLLAGTDQTLTKLDQWTEQPGDSVPDKPGSEPITGPGDR